MRHTPGPWKVRESGQSSDPDRVIYAQHFGGIADVNTLNGNTVDRSANAQLLAAAPDLLKACKDALAYLNYLKRFHAGHGDFSEMPSFANTQRDLAVEIAKAGVNS